MIQHIKTPAIVLGGRVTALTVVQSLGRLAVPVYLIGSNTNDIAYYSRYATPIDQVDVKHAGQVMLSIRKIAGSLKQKPVLLSCSDHFLEMVSANRDELQEHCHLNLPSTEAVKTVLNKGLFGDFCAKHDLPAPRSWRLETEGCFQKCAATARFPVAVKPLFKHRAKAENFQDDGRYAAMILAKDAIELKRLFSELTINGANLVVQEYIEGPDCEHYSYVSYRDSSGRELVGVGIRKIRIVPVHAGAGTYAEVSDDTDLAAEAARVLDALNYKGISSVCFKRDVTSGKLMLHEVNGRFPQPHSASWLCGINLPYVAYLDAVSEQPDIRRISHKRKKWIILRSDFRAFREYRRLGEMSTLDWLRSLLQVRVCTEIARDDLRPFLFLLKDWLRNAWGRMTASGPTRF